MGIGSVDGILDGGEECVTQFGTQRALGGAHLRGHGSEAVEVAVELIAKFSL